MLTITHIKEQVGCNTSATDVQIKICNIKLKQNNLPELPVDFCNLIKTANGFSNEDCLIFGAETDDNNHYKDVFLFNKAYFHGKTSHWLILGENDFFYLIYDEIKKTYHIADRDTLETEYSDTTLNSLIELFLRIE